MELKTSEFVLPMAAMARSNSSNGHVYHHHHETSTTSSSSSSTASAQRRSMEHYQQQQVPGTPGRPLLFLSSSSSSPAHPHQLVPSRRPVPSKWEDAEKWLRQSSSSSSDHRGKPSSSKQHNNGGGGLVQRAAGAEKKDPVTARRSSLDSALALYTPPAEVLLKDKFTESDNAEPSKESFVFRSSSYCEPSAPKNNGELHRRDMGTEMTPMETSRCQTPVKSSSSPARHNTPTGARSGPLVPYTGNGGKDISELTDCHFAKLDLGAGAQFDDDAMLVNWSSKEEEEEEVSKSLRHFEASTACDRRGAAMAGECRWEDDERAKSCIRYQREEAKIQAWINLESAKAEAQSRKLEVKIQKMRSSLEEKLMRRMTSVHRRGEEWRAAAQAQHLQQLRRAAATEHQHARRVKTISHRLSGNRSSNASSSCGCFPCNSNGGGVVSGNLLNYY